MQIGVLAVQGDFSKHQDMLRQMGIDALLVRTPAALLKCDGLIIPGGESTTLTTVMQKHGLWQPLQAFGRRKVIFGTCAGLIIMANEVPGHPHSTLDLIDITVERNAYGRQVDSFIDKVKLELSGTSRVMEGVFIRAPKIKACGANVRVLGYHGKDVVAAENEHILVCTFHPELTEDETLHRYFLHKVSRHIHD